METSTVLYHRQDNVGIITLNRPHRLNALTSELLKAFKEKLIIAREDKAAAVIIITGAGKGFCSGEDLKETAAGKSVETWIDEAEQLQDVQRLTLKLDKPLIGAIRGYAVGGGCEIAMSCDIRIAAEGAKFGFPETGVGLTVTNAGTKLLTHIVGLGKAKELIFTGEFIDADEALKIGLVNRVVSGETLLEAAIGMAQQIAKRSPLALRLSRIALDQGMSASFEEILELEASHLLVCTLAGNEKSFVERRLAEMKKK
jgi:enoyl-CoA hydratase